jgi:hypothetical protein
MGPTNYAACIGSGVNGGSGPLGSPWNADGAFQARTAMKLSGIFDGTSKTAAFSESILGAGPLATTNRTLVNAKTGYGFALTAPLTDAACARPDASGAGAAIAGLQREFIQPVTQRDPQDGSETHQRNVHKLLILLTFYVL